MIRQTNVAEAAVVTIEDDKHAARVKSDYALLGRKILPGRTDLPDHDRATRPVGRVAAAYLVFETVIPIQIYCASVIVVRARADISFHLRQQIERALRQVIAANTAATC